MEPESSPLVLFPENPALPWIRSYQQECLSTYAAGTVAVYSSILRHFTHWIMEQTRKRTTFHPDQFTPTAIEHYLSDLSAQGYSVSHRKRAKVVIAHFCQWLVDDKALLARNPVRGVNLPEPSTSGVLPPRSLTPTQRVLLHSLVKKDDVRGQALFALGYWAGCRVKDITHLLVRQTHLGEKSGWLHLGDSDEKSRALDLPNEARRPLYAYLQKRRRDETSPYVFTSQRSARLTEAGLHHWFRTLKSRAHPSEQEFLAEVSFHTLRDDCIHRAIEAGWMLEEIAYYAGNMTNIGTLALQSRVRYLQVTRAQVKEKLKTLKG